MPMLCPSSYFILPLPAHLREKYMATSHPNLFRKGRYWHYSLKVAGLRAHGSTRATDLATAKKVMEAKRRELLDGETRRRETLPTLTKLVDEWFQANRGCLSPKHLTRTEQIARIWLLPRLGSLPVNRIRTTDSTAPVFPWTPIWGQSPERCQ